MSAVRPRRHTDFSADIEEGHLSAALAHLANASYRLGTDQPLVRPPDLPPPAGCQRDVRSLQAAPSDNDIPPDRTSLRMGRHLSVDPTRETFVSSGQDADALLSRSYRSGFVMPSSV